MSSGTNAGLEQHVDSEVAKFLMFARRKRLDNLREVDGMFEDFVEDHINEPTYTSDEVVALTQKLQRHVRTNVAAELQHVAHVTTVLLQQLHAQASKWYLRLSSDLAQLDDAALLAAVAAFETNHVAMGAAGAGGQAAGASGLPPLAAFSDESLGLLRNKISELEQANAQLREERDGLHDSVQELSAGLASDESALAAANSVITQLRADLDKATQNLALREAALDQATAAAGVSETASAGPTAGDSTVADLRAELLEATSQIRAKDLEISALNAELEAKISKTSPFLSLKKMLRKKNELIKSLRASLAQAGASAS